VPQPTVTTRPATRRDIPLLLGLWDELRDAAGRTGRTVSPPASVDLPARLLKVIADPTFLIVLACANDQPAGLAVIQVATPDPLSDHQHIHVSHLVVSRVYQRRGVGHALIAAAADFATVRGVDRVTVGVLPTLRESNRFFARLGFAPAATYRIAQVATLRRRLVDSRSPVFTGLVRRRVAMPRRATSAERPRSHAQEQVRH
jgi:ribosomal protein S18 acetylase RimI-like enzyme